MLCVLPIWHLIRATQLILDRREVNVDRNSKAFGLGANENGGRLSWNNFESLWKLHLQEFPSYQQSEITCHFTGCEIIYVWDFGSYKTKKNLQHFYHLDRPVTTCNLFFQGTRCKTWETYTAERFTKPWAGGAPHLDSSGFHSFIVENSTTKCIMR